jgi:hypothetical protein
MCSGITLGITPWIKLGLPQRKSYVSTELVAHTGFAIEPQTTDFSIEPLKTGFSPKPHFVRKIAKTENQ